MDQAVLLPALLHALYQNQSRSLVAVFALISAGVEIANFRGVPLGNTLLYPWTSVVWLVWYLYASRGTQPGPATEPGLPPIADTSSAA